MLWCILPRLESFQCCSPALHIRTEGFCGNASQFQGPNSNHTTLVLGAQVLRCKVSLQGSFAAYRAQGALRLVRLVVWEAALLYGVTLFVHAWNAEGAAGSVFLLVMNAIELVLAVMAGLASLRR